MATAITARAKCGNKTPYTDQVSLSFYADYNDERNKEWSKYTPALSVSMTVIPEVAEHFEVGKNYTLTFTPDED